MKLRLAISLALLAGVAAGFSRSNDDAAIIKAQRAFYPLTTCPMSGEELGDTAVDYVHEGRLVRFCCPDCKGAFVEAPEKVLAKLDEAIIADQKPYYTVQTCPVSGEKLGSMGEPIGKVVANRYVELCCKGCIKTLAKTPDKVLATVDEKLLARKIEAYPFDTCLVSGEKLGSMGKPIDKLVGVDAVRFCCKGCLKAFDKQPRKYIAEIRAAASKPAEKKKEEEAAAGL